MISATEIFEFRKKGPPEFPSFDVKDFQPDGSLEQLHQIQHSINEIKNIVSYKTVKPVNSLSQAIWHEDLHLAEITRQTGPYWLYMGHTIGEKLYIHPEEALYLLETGSIQITYNGVPLSVQRAYFIFFNCQNDITVEKYRVYAVLHNYGYKVLRHSPKNSVTSYEKKLELHKLGIKLKNSNSIAMVGKPEQESLKESIKINKKLKIDEGKALPVINKMDNNSLNIQGSQHLSSHNSESELKFDYDIYLESSDKQSFKKSCLQLPNFRVVIHRGDDPIPEFEELCKLSKKYKDEIPVIHAIVFFDNIAFYKIDPVTLPDLND